MISMQVINLQACYNYIKIVCLLIYIDPFYFDLLLFSFRDELMFAPLRKVLQHVANMMQACKFFLCIVDILWKPIYESKYARIYIWLDYV